MLLVCRPDLDKQAFERLEKRLSSVPQPLRWGRRGNRLVILLRAAHADQPEWKDLTEDPAVEAVLANPSEGEIARLFSRRDLLDFSIWSTGVLAAAAVVGPLALYLTSPAGQRSPRGDLLLGRANLIPINGSLTRLIDGEEFLIIRRGENDFHALSATCTHSQVCLLSWNPELGQIVCPCHRGIYDAFGNVVSGPPPRPLARREVVVRDGSLYVKRTPV